MRFSTPSRKFTTLLKEIAETCRNETATLVHGGHNGIGVLLSTLGAIAMWDFGMHWYPIALIVSSLPCAWIAGRLYLAGTAKTS